MKYWLMKAELVFFYHCNCGELGIVGIVRIKKAGHLPIMPIAEAQWEYIGT